MAQQVRLEWASKRPPTLPQSVPELRTLTQYGSAAGAGRVNRLILGDNLDVAASLLQDRSGPFVLIYIDPPFFSGRDWQMHLPGGATEMPETAYTDTWNNDLGQYLQWLYDRLAAARDLLAETGSLYLHLNWQAVHYARLIMDEVFGIQQFQNEIAWCYREAINSKRRWNRKHDSILFYSRSDEFTFNCDRVREPYAESTVRKFTRADAKGPYRLMGRGITGSPLRSKRDLAPEMETLYPELTYRHYLGNGTLPVDYWQIDIENQASARRTGYPTQKPEALLERILMASSNEGDLVADLCCGSGTTLAVAHKLGRRWVGCDIGEKAIEVSQKRLEGLGAAFTVESCIRS